MSCTPTPTATQYATITTFTTSTSYSQSAAGAQVTTVVQQSCVASGTISGSSVGCISSTQVTQVDTVGGGQTAQVPIVVTVPVTETEPTQTLFAPCTGSSSTSQSDTSTPLTTSVLVQSTPPPSTVVESSSTTLSDGSVVQTVVTMVSTLPPTSIYVPTTSLSSPTLQSNSSQGSGTNVAPIIGGVLGGFFGLVVIVGSLWWLCRRRRSWDDIFEKEDLQNDDAWGSAVPVRRERDRRTPDSSAGPRPYEYGLVGRVIPPAAAGEPTRSSHRGSVSEHSGGHSRQTSFSATPLLQGTHTGSSRPSTAGSLTAQIQPVPRVKSTATEPRSLSIVSSNSTRPLLDDRSSSPALLSNWTPDTDNLVILEPLNRTGSPATPAERRVLQIVNDGPPSPSDTVVPDARRTSSRRKTASSVIVHTDGGRVPENSLTEPHADPPAYTP